MLCDNCIKLTAENAHLTALLDATTGDAMCARAERDSLRAHGDELQTECEHLRARLEKAEDLGVHWANSFCDAVKERDELKRNWSSCKDGFRNMNRNFTQARAQCEKLAGALRDVANYDYDSASESVEATAKRALLEYEKSKG